MKMQSRAHLAQSIASELAGRQFPAVKRRYSSIILTSLFVVALTIIAACGGGGSKEGSGSSSGSHIISASSGEGGGISPGGTVQVTSGNDQLFDMTPYNGYGVANVVVDGASVGAVTAYTFTNVTGNHTISATFTNEHTITTSAGENGSISPSGNITVGHGSDQTLIITSDPGYKVKDVLVSVGTDEAVSVGAKVIYTFADITANHTISATFKPTPAGTYKITATAYPGGTISPEDNVDVDEGNDQTFDITPDAGYKIADVVVDDVSVLDALVNNTYIFTNVTADHTISVTFHIAIGDISGMSSGMNFSVVLEKDTGKVLTWGLNDNGQLGNGNNDDSSIPVWVNNLANVSAVTAGGHHALAIIDGNVWAWGDNDDPLSDGSPGGGALGNGTTIDSNVPTQVCEWSGCGSFLSGVIAIAAGRHHSLALNSDNSILVWGAGQSTLPKTITDGGGNPYTATAIATGRTSSIALQADGTILAFGGNGFGQLGDGTTTDRLLLPMQVCDTGETSPCGSVLSNVIAIASGMYHSLALKNDGTVWAWGRNDAGQLGAVTTETCSGYDCSTTPVQVSGLTGIFAISGGRWQSYAMDDNGNVWAWGGNSAGQLGNGTTTGSATPVQVCANGATAPCSSANGNALSNITAITNSSAFSMHSLALDADEVIWAWGNNDNGGLGDDTTTGSTTPVSVAGTP